ncbi:rhophilin-1-like isoform X2 [Varroa jacobsoni]|uniref:Rhophilin-2 n=1 Tax=Varroa destructor TaxID=109461 RepID=A0A7M7J0P1_VARDE|nr:rhophilin-1-like isoform X3 [Varroa destructor]XP_022707214.1 rhophilin-1-like isoform X2 [Varroa jacobsoni]XP_022707215.1 rhophilin-1-like isoform X2 [Varroa jacobsoni]
MTDTGYSSDEERRIIQDSYIRKVRGSDPRAATCRGKMQFRRSKLNKEITKQIHIRDGAEKLYKATTNKKLKETVALELSFLNSNLQLLKEQLAELNSSVQMYQNENQSQIVPMIPLGLKETKDMDFTHAFSDFIAEHYGEELHSFADAICEFQAIRQAARTPSRNQAGVQLLFEYYNLLYFVDRRFFHPKSSNVYFEWFDSLTGVPSTQKTVAFEKASVLFNIAALYTQIGAKQDRSKHTGIDAAVDSFLRAAGMFCYIRDNFSKPPSMDLNLSTLECLSNIMLAQARECLFEKLVLSEPKGLLQLVEVGQEAAEVAEVYAHVHKLLIDPPIKDYLPYSWVSLLSVKAEHYRALAHFYVACGLLEHKGELTEAHRRTIEYVHVTDQDDTSRIDIRVPRASDERVQLAKAHLHESLLLHEEALRLHRMCRQLRHVDNLQARLRLDHEIAIDKYAQIEQEDDFNQVLDPPHIQPSTKYQLTLTPPDFSAYKVKDPFHALGPISVFSARNQWTSVRKAHMKREKNETFGFSVKGDSPTVVAGVEPCSLAELSGVKEGDLIVGIGDRDTKWSTHEEVVDIIRDAGDEITINIVTPITSDQQRSLLEGSLTSPRRSSSQSPTASVSSGVSSTGSSRLQSPNGSITSGKGHRKSSSWNIFKRKGSTRSSSPLKDDSLIIAS